MRQIGGFTAGRIIVPKEGPLEAASPVRLHRLHASGIFINGLDETLQRDIHPIAGRLAKTNQIK